jgi:hypothetical protein
MEPGQLQNFVNQLVSLAWLRCAMEEGVKFINKQTGKQEYNEMVVFQHLEHQTGAFDVPKADVTPKGMERCLYETIGNFFINNTNPDVRLMIESPDFRSLIQRKVSVVKEKGAQMLRGSPIEDETDVTVARKKHATP